MGNWVLKYYRNFFNVSDIMYKLFSVTFLSHGQPSRSVQYLVKFLHTVCENKGADLLCCNLAADKAALMH